MQLPDYLICWLRTDASLISQGIDRIGRVLIAGNKILAIDPSDADLPEDLQRLDAEKSLYLDWLT